VSTQPRRLRTQIAGTFILVLTIWCVVMIGSLEYIISRTASTAVLEQGLYVTRSLAAECAPHVHYDDIGGLSRTVRERIESIAPLRYAFVQDASGTLIWSSFSDGTPLDLLDVEHDRVLGSQTTARLLRLAGEEVFDYEHRRAGLRVRTGFSLEPVSRMVYDTVPSVLWIGLAGLLAVFALALHVSRPVEALASALASALSLDESTGGGTPFDSVLETSTIATEFHSLMDRLEQRTRQLDSARKLAYLGEISTSIAHEVNNPLGVVVLDSSYLMKRMTDGDFDAAASRRVKRLWTAARRATLVAQKFLQFSRYSRTARPVTRPVDLAGLIEETLELFEDRIRLSGCTVRAELPPDLGRFASDEQGIQQVFLNLLTNALDASPKGSEIVVEVTLGEGQLSLSVVDRGEGVPEEVLSRITEPFYSTKRDGSGLGLAISKSIAETLSGKLRFETTPGRGTTATLEIPIEEES